MSYRYRLFDADGGEQGEIRLAVLVAAGETIHRGPDQPALRVVFVVNTADTPYSGLLQIEDVDHRPSGGSRNA
jgi:hypothetical protein